MKVNNCRRLIATLSLVMFLGFGPFDWLSLITNYFFSQSDAVVEQAVPQNDGSGTGSASPLAAPASADTSGQCPMCPGPRPQPRPIPPT